jgi:predicted PurR-regulated permease PerM
VSDNNSQKGFFFVLLFAVTVAFLWLIRGFMQPIFWAIAFGVVVYPVHMAIKRRLHGRESLSAVLSVLALVIIVILPLTGVATAVAREATALYEKLDAGDVGLDSIYREAEERAPRVMGFLQRFGLQPDRFRSQLSSAALGASRFVAARAVEIGQNTVRVTVLFFLMLYLLFFFLRDGKRILDALVRALPLGDARERFLMRRFAEVSRATIKGTMVVGIVQGTIGGIAFAVLGIGAPVLWGAVMAFLSLLPAVGSALIWLPAAIILIVSGRVVAGIALVVVGVLVIGLVDNFLRPLLVGRDTRMPDYLILLSTLGGLAGFGFAGIVIGPIIAAFFLAVWQMAHSEFAEAPPS